MGLKRICETEATTGLESLLGERVTLYCLNYIYTGTLSAISETDVCLKDAAIVYETGPFDTAEWQDAQPLPHDWWVRLAAVESYGILKVSA